MTYYRFQNEAPRPGEVVHCYTNEKEFRSFVKMMKSQDPQFLRMKFWEVTGQYIRPDEGDAVVRVVSVKQINV